MNRRLIRLGMGMRKILGTGVEYDYDEVTGTYKMFAFYSYEGPRTRHELEDITSNQKALNFLNSEDFEIHEVDVEEEYVMMPDETRVIVEVTLREIEIPIPEECMLSDLIEETLDYDHIQLTGYKKFGEEHTVYVRGSWQDRYDCFENKIEEICQDPDLISKLKERGWKITKVNSEMTSSPWDDWTEEDTVISLEKL